MGWFARFRKRPESSPEPRPSPPERVAPAPRSEPIQFWKDHGLQNGDVVDCARCGRSLTVRLSKPGQITIAVAGTFTGQALICGDCGRLLCEACSAPPGQMRPSCDRCNGLVSAMV